MHLRPTMKVLLVAVFVVVASLAGILVNFPGRTTSSPSILSVVATTAFDFNATLGLNLTLTVNPINAAQGRFTYLSASIVNPGSAPILLQPTGTAMRVSAGPCSQLPLGVGIAAGNYGRNNFSEEALGTIFYPGAFHCPLEINIDRYSFAPQSGNVTMFSHLQQAGPSNLTSSQLVGTMLARISTQAWGFWTPSPRSDPLFPCCFRSFLPGVYTAVARDEWGQVVITHFEVSDVSAFPDCNTVASNASFVRHVAGMVAPGPLFASTYYVDPSDNQSIFLPLTNELTRSMTLMGIVDPSGNGFYMFQGNYGSPDLGGSWYAVAPGGPLEYPFSVPAGTCSLLHVDFGGKIKVGVQLRLLLSDGVNETLTVKG